MQVTVQNPIEGDANFLSMMRSVEARENGKLYACG